MLSTYTYPGLYLQDVYPPPDPSLLTGVPVFLGWAEQGTTNAPQLISFWRQFSETFGSPSDSAYRMPYAVRGFFENGGLVCYVVRLNRSNDPLADLQAGLAAIELLDDSDLVCAPDVWSSPTTARFQHQAILDHCARHQNHFALLDGLSSPDYSALIGYRHQLYSAGGYGALYAPWLVVPAGNRNNTVTIPPCGHIAGVISRVDQQLGVFKAPANEVLEGVLDLAPLYNEMALQQLYSYGINGIRIIPGRDTRIWGCHTLSHDPKWRHINVRRLFLTMGRWFHRFMREVTFESMHALLWVRIGREISAYLERLFQAGAFAGATPEQAYFVKCDAGTNPPEVIQAGKIITEIGIAPAIPSEFIVVRLIHTESDVQLTTISPH